MKKTKKIGFLVGGAAIKNKTKKMPQQSGIGSNYGNLTVTTCDVVFGRFLRGVGKDLVGLANLNHIT